LGESREAAANPLGRRALFILFALALCLRLALVATTRGDPVFAVPMLDAEYAVDWAERIAVDGFWTSPEQTAYFRLPLYAWFLAGLFALPGPDLLAARLPQALLGAAAAPLLAHLAGRHGGRAAGIATGILTAVSWPLLLFGRELLIASLVVPLGALILLVLERARVGGFGRWLVVGLSVGVATLARANFLACVLLALALAIVQGLRRRDARGPLALTLGTLLVLAPIAVRNHRASGDWIPLTYQGGLNLWIGNNPQADGMSASLPGFTSWRNEDVEALLSREYGRPLSPGEQDAHFRRLALDFFRESPGKALALLARKTYLLFQGYEIRNNRDLYALRERDPLLRLPLPDFGWIGPLALLGAVFGWRRRRELAAVYGYAILMSAGVILFFVCSRYRLAVWPAFLVFAGVGVGGLLSRATPHPRRLGAFVLLALLVFAARWDFLGIRHPDPSQVHFQYGNVYARAGLFAQAEAEYRAALGLQPAFGEARYHLGAILLRQGRLDEAERELSLSVELLPLSYRARRSLAEVQEAAGRLDRAIESRRAVIALAPGSFGDELALANTLGMAGRYGEAWQLYEKLLAEHGEDDPWLTFNAGQTALVLGNQERGLPLLEDARREPRTREAASEALALWLLSQRRYDEALRVLSEAILNVQDNPRLYKLRGAARFSTGDATGARKDLERVLSLDPQDEEARARLHELETFSQQ
jgi:tetratricopeptide (TPR) repeat protein